MSLELDKRIKSMQNIETVFSGCKDWLFMGKMGYFADNLEEFRDLTKCVYGEYMGYAEKDQCFTAEVRGNATQFVFRYFIPEDVLIPEEPEKKYRVLTLNEFLERFKIGDAIYIRFKKDGAERVVVFSEYNIPPHKDEGNNTESVCLTGIEHHLKSVVCLGIREYDLTTLFENYEYFDADGKEWKTFGVKE